MIPLAPIPELALAQQGAPAVELLSTIGLYHYLVVALAMFALGVVGFLSRRNLIIMFLCTELMFQGAAIALIAFSRYWLNHTGEVFVIFVLTVAAAEAAMALALVVLLYRKRETLDALAWSSMRG